MIDGDTPVLVSEDAGIARITLNRPRAGNSLSMTLVAALRAELGRIAADPRIKVIVLSGMGGADLFGGA